MRPADNDAEVVAMLDAIDATLAGEPVDPDYAEIAELALLVQAERPVPQPNFTQELNERVARRFGPQQPTIKPARRSRAFWWTLAPAGLIAGGIAAVVVLGSNGAGSASSGSTASESAPTLAVRGTNGRAGSRNQSLALKAAPNLGPNIPAPALHVPNNGRKQVQSSQLTLGVVPKRIDSVAQEIFNVVGAQNGFVDSSQVTAGGSDGYAHFQLMIPSGLLAQTMSQLSSVRYARVLTRTDSVRDVTSQYRNAVRHHKKSELKSLKRKIAYSQVTVTIQAYTPPPPHRVTHHSGFSIGSAARTALHVLTVVAGVALIVLAVLVPLALVGALVGWIASTLKRRRREQALDAA